jgi:hypothetical protein
MHYVALRHERTARMQRAIQFLYHTSLAPALRGWHDTARRRQVVCLSGFSFNNTMGAPRLLRHGWVCLPLSMCLTLSAGHRHQKGCPQDASRTRVGKSLHKVSKKWQRAMQEAVLTWAGELALGTDRASTLCLLLREGLDATTGGAGNSGSMPDQDGAAGEGGSLAPVACVHRLPPTQTRGPHNP